MKKFLSLLFVLMMAGVAKAEQLQVDFNTSGGTIVYKGSGILHSMDATNPSAALFNPVKVRRLRSSVSLTETAYTRVTANGGKLQAVVSDTYGYSSAPNTPGELASWSATATSVATTVNNAGHAANYEFDIWNEPDNGSFWVGGTVAEFHEAWKQGFQAIRAVIPTAVIVGPSYWSYNATRMGVFLDYCKANSVCPDILSWHEINGPDASGSHLIDDHKSGVSGAVALLAARSINITRFSINEINSGSPGRYHPGYIVHFLGSIERNNIESAARACFPPDCDDDSLDGLLTPAFGTRSAWWVHKMYADMTGTIVTTTPTNTNGQGLEAVATKDSANNKAFLLLGQFGTVSGGINVRFNNMSSVAYLTNSVNVKIEGLDDSDTAVSTGPVTVSETSYTVNSGVLDVPIPNTTYEAYLLTLTAGSAPPTGGNYTGVWTQKSPINSAQFVGDRGFASGKPVGRTWVPGSYDTQRGSVLLMGGSDTTGCTGGGTQGGYLNDWWSYTAGTNAWLQFSANNPSANNTTAPMGRDNHSLTYDWDQDLYWMYGGNCSSGLNNGITTNFHSIWSYNPDNGVYTRYDATAPNGPDNSTLWARYNPAFKYVGNNTIVFYGGEHGSFRSDTWEFNTSTHLWTQTHANGAASAPPIRGQIENAFAWDSAHGKLIIFGGQGPNSGTAKNDTWAYDPVTDLWQNMNPQGTVPTARIQHGMTYDAALQVVVLFGGQTVTDVKFNDTWVYSYASNTWSQVSPSVSPLARSHNILQYSSGAARTFLFGGATTSKVNDLWELQLSSSGPPALQITTLSLPDGQVGNSYSQTILATGGTSPYTFSLFSGTLPAGLTLSAGGLLSGTPTTAAAYTFTVRVTDSLAVTANQGYSVTISPPPPPSSVPDLQDERDAYDLWGWTYTSSDEPNEGANPGFTAVDPDIHGETEGDDLWTSLMQYQRTGQQGYLDRATAWARYFKDDYRQCVGTAGTTYCHDRDSFLYDHMYGRGLLEWYGHSGNAAYLTAAENLANDVETFWNVPGQMTADGCPVACMSFYGSRMGARHLMLATRLAEITGLARWVTLRDKLINLWINSPDWDPTRGIYWVSQSSTDSDIGAGSYASGLRLQSSFQLGLLTEAFWKAYQATGNATLRARLLSMATFIYNYGIDPDTQLTAGKFVFNLNTSTVDHGGAPHSPAYCTSLVNLLTIGYKLTGNANYYTRAKYHLNQGTKFSFNTGTRLVPDSEVHHFVDSRFESSSGFFFYDYNKGELQYCYLIFENGGMPSVEGGGADTTPPAAPTNLRRTQ